MARFLGFGFQISAVRSQIPAFRFQALDLGATRLSGATGSQEAVAYRRSFGCPQLVDRLADCGQPTLRF